MSRINGTAEHAWRVLRKHPNATAREVAAHMGVPIMTASNAEAVLIGDPLKARAIADGGTDRPAIGIQRMPVEQAVAKVLKLVDGKRQ